MEGRARASPRSARAFRTILFILAAALAIYACLFAWWLHATDGLVLSSKSLWSAAFGTIFVFISAWCFPVRSQLAIFMILVWLLVVEVLLQITSWVGLLPGVNTKAKVPYGRVYWTSEGHGNSIRNHFGWHFPEFDLHAKHRVAVIGDSFVEAVEVGRSRNLAAQLQTALRKNGSDWAVFGLGTHGSCPAHHLDVLDYAQRYFAPQEAIVAIYTGNDVTECSPKLNYLSPENYIYYDLDPDGQLALNPASIRSRADFIKSMEVCHRTIWMHLPAIANSHCMLLQIPLSVRAAFEIVQRQREGMARNSATLEFAKVGLNPAVAAVHPTPEVEHAFAIMFAELQRLKEMCDRYGITLRLVTIPSFPERFYETQRGRDWTMHLGDFDFLVPEQRLAHFASEHGISHLELGGLMQAKKLDVKEIRALYLSNGIGHFSEAGHRFCADAIFATFYKTSLSALSQ